MGLIGTAGFALVLDYLALVVHFLEQEFRRGSFNVTTDSLNA